VKKDRGQQDVSPSKNPAEISPGSKTREQHKDVSAYAQLIERVKKEGGKKVHRVVFFREGAAVIRKTEDPARPGKELNLAQLTPAWLLEFCGDKMPDGWAGLPRAGKGARILAHGGNITVNPGDCLSNLVPRSKERRREKRRKNQPPS